MMSTKYLSATSSQHQDDAMSVSFAKRCLEHLHDDQFEDVSTEGSPDKNPDLVRTLQDGILHETEVKRGICKESMGTHMGAKEQSRQTTKLTKYWHIYTDESSDRQQHTGFKKINVKLEPLLKKLESKNIETVEQTIGPTFNVDGKTYRLDLNMSFDLMRSLPERERYRDERGDSVDPDVYALCLLFGTASPSIRVFPDKQGRTGWRFIPTDGGFGTADPDEYIRYVIAALEKNVEDYAKMPDKFQPNSYKTLFVDSGIDSPGTYGVLHDGDPKFVPTKAPKIAECIDEFIVYNPTQKDLLIWRRGKGWCSTDAEEFERQHIQEWFESR